MLYLSSHVLVFSLFYSCFWGKEGLFCFFISMLYFWSISTFVLQASTMLPEPSHGFHFKNALVFISLWWQRAKRGHRQMLYISDSARQRGLLNTVFDKSNIMILACRFISNIEHFIANIRKVVQVRSFRSRSRSMVRRQFGGPLVVVGP